MASNTSVVLGGGNYTSIAGGSLDMLPVLLKKKLLAYLEKNVVFDRYADKEPLPEGNGKVVRYTRYPRVGLPFIPATEGITPTDLRQLAPEVVEAAVDQWIDVGEVTDVAEMTIAHKPLQLLLDRMGTAAGELVDREHQRVLQNYATPIFTDAAYGDRTEITVNDFMNADVVRRVTAQMRDDGVPDYNGMYLAIHDPYTNMDLQKDSVFATAASMGNMNDRLFKGLLSTQWLGCNWVSTNHIPYLERQAALSSISTATPADAAHTLAAEIDIQITGYTMFGFDKYIGAVVYPGSWATNDIVTFTLPVISGIVAYDVYAGPHSGTMKKLNSAPLLPGTTAITGDGAATSVYTNILAYSTTGDVAPVVPGAGVKVHRTYILGREAFGNVELSGLEVLMTPKVPSDTDPALQRRKISYKLFFKPVVKNTQFYRIIEHESEFD